MYTTSDDWKDAIYGNVKSTMNIYINEQLIDVTNILEFKKGGTLFDDSFSLGSTMAQYIEMRLYKNNLPTTLSTVKVEYGILIDDAYEMIPLGTFNVESYEDNDDNTVTIKATDNMIKFETNYKLSELLEGKESVTMLEIIQDICTKVGVELGSTSFLNADKATALYDDSITAREYISYIAELAGGYARISRDGKLYIETYGDSVATIDFNLFGSYKWKDETKITKVYSSVLGLGAGDDTGSTIYINQDNLYVTSQEDIQSIYNSIKNKIVYSFEGKSVIDPAIDYGDIILIDNKPVIFQGTMDMQTRFIADIESEIQIKENEEVTELIKNEATSKTRIIRKIDEISGTISILNETTDDLSDMIGTTNTTVGNNYTEIIGKLDGYVTSDDIVLLKKDVETAQSSSDYAIRVSKDIQVNGVSKVTTTTGFTFNDEGLTIEKTGAVTKSILDETGLDIKDATGSSDDDLLFAGYDETTGEAIVKSKNITVDKYLIVGKYTRFEDYTDEDGNEATGVFWIGG